MGSHSVPEICPLLRGNLLLEGSVKRGSTELNSYHMKSSYLHAIINFMYCLKISSKMGYQRVLTHSLCRVDITIKWLPHFGKLTFTSIQCHIRLFQSFQYGSQSSIMLGSVFPVHQCIVCLIDDAFQSIEDCRHSLLVFGC